MRAAAVLLVVGLTQMVADLTGNTALKGLAAATMCSPCPKVFTAHRGYETFSTRFVLSWHDKAGAGHQLPLSRELYSRIRGPYGRRKIFEAVVVHWPLASVNARVRPMFLSVCQYSLTGRAPLLRELGVNPQDVAGPLRIYFVPRAGAEYTGLPHYLETSCL